MAGAVGWDGEAYRAGLHTVHLYFSTGRRRGTQAGRTEGVWYTVLSGCVCTLSCRGKEDPLSREAENNPIVYSYCVQSGWCLNAAAVQSPDAALSSPLCSRHPQ